MVSRNSPSPSLSLGAFLSARFDAVFYSFRISLFVAFSSKPRVFLGLGHWTNPNVLLTQPCFRSRHLLLNLKTGSNTALLLLSAQTSLLLKLLGFRDGPSYLSPTIHVPFFGPGTTPYTLVSPLLESCLLLSSPPPELIRPKRQAQCRLESFKTTPLQPVLVTHFLNLKLPRSKNGCGSFLLDPNHQTSLADSTPQQKNLRTSTLVVLPAPYYNIYSRASITACPVRPLLLGFFTSTISFSLVGGSSFTSTTASNALI